jgi:hypothetical protein
MVKITHLEVREQFQLHLIFDDGVEKTIDGMQFIGPDPLTSALGDPVYFQQVQVYDNGRGIYWPNNYDICPDNLRYHIPAIDETHSSQAQVA